MVFAKGRISNTGRVYSGMNIKSATWDPMQKHWVVEFEEGKYNVNRHVTLVTPIGIPPDRPSVLMGSYDQSGTNAVAVAIAESKSGSLTKAGFSLVVFEP